MQCISSNSCVHVHIGQSGNHIWFFFTSHQNILFSFTENKKYIIFLTLIFLKTKLFYKNKQPPITNKMVKLKQQNQKNSLFQVEYSAIMAYIY